MTCSSCRIPSAKNAEFLINNSSVDTITFDDEMEKCYYLHGECTSDVYSCSFPGNEFSRFFVFDKHLNTDANYSCEMRFKAKSVAFSKVVTVSFNGKGK